MVLSPPRSTPGPAARRVTTPYRPGRPANRPLAPDVAAVAAGIGLGASIAVPLSQTSLTQLRAPGGLAILLGDVTAMAGTYLLLIMVLLAARIPALERVVGQDRMIRWHRRLSSAPLVLLGAHGLFTVLGFAESARTGWWSEAGTLLTTMSWIFAAVVSYAMFVGIAGVSIRAVRRKFSYDTWWVIHLYTYLALAFSVPHQIFSGTNFIGRPAVQALWLLLWFSTAGVVVIYRIALPVGRSLYHRLELVEIRPEGADTYSLVVRGRHLERLAVAGGQYFGWRFLVRGMWWHAHPFSLSARPRPPYMRVTIKVAGDSTAAIARLQPGTRIAVEGPYGAFTAAARTRRRVAMIGAGVGITPLRALVEDLPSDVDVVVVRRTSTAEELVLRQEMASIVDARRGRLVELVGARTKHRLNDPRYLHKVIPDLATRDLYVCGPEAFAAGVAEAARRLGVEPGCIHYESFEF